MRGEAAQSARSESPAADSAASTAACWEQFVLLSAVTLGLFWEIELNHEAGSLRSPAILLVVGILVAVSVVRNMRFASWATLCYAVAVGVVDRLQRPLLTESDVMAATQEAIQTLAKGENPYLHVYLTTHPTHSPFPYLPGEIAFYAIPNALFGHVVGTDRWAGIGVLLLLACLAPCVGPAPSALAAALYGTFGLATYRALDGSNDTGLAFLIVLSVVFLAWSYRFERESFILFCGSAIAFAWALVFKQFAWLIYPFVVMHLRERGENWRLYAFLSLGMTTVAILPFFLAAPSAFLHNIVAPLSFHQNVRGLNMWRTVESSLPELVHRITPLLPLVSVIVVVVVGATLLLFPSANLGKSLLQGLLVVLVSLFVSRWTTSPYYTFAAALLSVAVALVPWPVTPRLTTHRGAIDSPGVLTDGDCEQ
jgi:hypothetical protein